MKRVLDTNISSAKKIHYRGHREEEERGKSDE